MTWSNALITEDLMIVTDTHWGHGRIIEYAKRPPEHNELMFARWREFVEPDRPVLHLGDVAMDKRLPEIELMEARIRALPGEKFLVRGNHDTRGNPWIEEHWGMEMINHHVLVGQRKQKRITVTVAGTRIAFSHRPLIWTEGQDAWDINIHGHIHINGWAQSFVDSRRDYRNVSVEFMDYRPWPLRDILNGRCQKISRDLVNPHDDGAL